ncbi:M20/M25/M40 family metallo-hydrolase [Sphingomonas rosea]|uniref:M20/M25/M40 family metallo-hydrolase n=2 Tax=Sphingomonas rosea TaxID=335605 RepID=A0ABP7UEG5_9SPHN
MRKAVALVAILVGLLAAMAATRWLTLPPPVRTANAPEQFDAARAKARLARILGDQAPHPADSAASDGVRDRLVAELRAMGLRPRIDDRFACNNLHKQSGVSCARVRNIVVTLGERPGAKHLLVNSHYDSVPVGPGASDAGLGVATMLEVASLMKDTPPRPVTFLFNEGEELGLVGARAFLDGDPLRDRVDALINLEARGTTGPVNMFETSVPNGAAVRLFGSSVAHPVANSLAVSAYRLIPNYTDVNSFAESRKWLTLNFAPIGNETRYHSPGDDVAAIDLATLQHMGDQVQATTTALGAGPAPAWQTGKNLLFMNIGTRSLFTLPSFIALGVVAGYLLGLGFRAVRNGGTHRRWLATVPLLLCAPLLATAIAWLGLSGVGALREGQFWRAVPQVSELAVYAGVIASGLLVLSWSRASQSALRRGWWTLYLLLGLALTFFAPGALVYFFVPPLLFLIGAENQHRWRHAELAGSLLAALLTFMTLGAMLGLLQDLANSGPLWIFALFGALVLMPWLIEARPLLAGASWRRAAPIAIAFAALAWVPAALAPAYSADRQQQWTLQYVLEAGKPPVWSIVNDRKPLPADLQKLGEWRQGTLPLGKRQRWLAAAPVQPGFAAPTLEPAGDIPILSAPVTGGPGTPIGRAQLFRLRTNGADSVSLGIDKQDALIGGGFNGRAVILRPGTKAPYSLTCTGRSCDGAVVQLDLGTAPVTVQLTATHWRLPPAAAPLQAARPRFARPQYLPDATILVSRLKL